MNDLFVPYKEALVLKELGFDEPCFMTYLNGKLDKELFLFNHSIRSHSTQEFTSAPLYQQAFKFFREKYGLYCYVSPFISYEGERRIVYDIFILEDKEDEFDWDDDPYSTYEEAELACLRKLIEIVND